MLAQAQRVGEVVRADLDSGFAHLVCGFRQRMRAALQHHDVQVGKGVAQLQRQAEPGQPAAEDHRIMRRLAHVHPVPESVPIVHACARRCSRCSVKTNA